MTLFVYFLKFQIQLGLHRTKPTTQEILVLSVDLDNNRIIKLVGGERRDLKIVGVSSQIS